MTTTFNIYVGNFVKTGDPNGGALADCPSVVPDRDHLLNFSLEDGPAFGPDPRLGIELVASRGRCVGHRAV